MVEIELGRLTYFEGALLPDAQIWWPTSDGGLVDFSGSTYTFNAKCGRMHGRGAPLFTKTTGFTGAAGSGSGFGPADTPNLTVAWLAGDLGLLTDPGLYLVRFQAARVSDSKIRVGVLELEITGPVFD